MLYIFLFLQTIGYPNDYGVRNRVILYPNSHNTHALWFCFCLFVHKTVVMEICWLHRTLCGLLCLPKNLLNNLMIAPDTGILVFPKNLLKQSIGYCFYFFMCFVLKTNGYSVCNLDRVVLNYNFPNTHSIVFVCSQMTSLKGGERLIC